MGLLNKLLGGGAEGCRESMRHAYEHHAKAARAKHMDSSHLIGLYGALRSRYRARGLAMDEAVMWGELVLFWPWSRLCPLWRCPNMSRFRSSTLECGESGWATLSGAQCRRPKLVP